MKKFRTIASLSIMVLSGIVGFFFGAALDSALSGAMLFSVIAGICCLIYTLDNPEK